MSVLIAGASESRAGRSPPSTKAATIRASKAAVIQRNRPNRDGNGEAGDVDASALFSSGPSNLLASLIDASLCLRSFSRHQRSSLLTRAGAAEISGA
jgi:hypothetical protein